MSEPNLASSALASEGNPVVLQEQLSLPELPCNTPLLETETPDVITDRAIADTERWQDADTQGIEPLRCYFDAWAAEHHELTTTHPDLIEALLQQATVALEAQRQHWEREQATLQATLRQARLRSHEQTERIRHLEQALDQSLVSLSEMRLQVVDQHLLEAQLASTEDISNIQQQAIARLKLQLSQQQQALTAQLTETQVRDRSLQTLLHTMDALTQAQQQELEHLQNQMAHDRTEVQRYQQRLEIQLEQLQIDLDAHQERTLALENQSLDARTLADHLTTRLARAQAQVSELAHILSDRQVALSQLEAELQQAHLTLQEQQALLDSLQHTHLPNASVVSNLPASSASDASAAAVTQAIAVDLVAARAKIAALEAQAAKQITTQAMLRHACQELEEERDRQHVRLTELEHQTTDMQEQILRQAQQASEYETAIQHWKDRCLSSQSGLLKLQELLDQTLPDRPAALSELLATLLAAADETAPGSPALLPTTSFQREKVDLPEFLLRRRNYKTRRS